jgi:hypothetical protein
VAEESQQLLSHSSSGNEVSPGTPTENHQSFLGPFCVFLILIAAAIPWRSKTYFEGGTDSVVLAKAALSMASLGLAIVVGVGRRVQPVQVAPLLFLTLYLACTVLGGWSSGELVPSMVIAIRVLLIAVTVTGLASRYDGTHLLACLIAALASFAVVGSVTGLGTLAEGRLSGSLPPLHANELASTCAVLVLWCLWRIVNGRDGSIHIVGLALFLVVLLATGSRTPLAALAIGFIVLAIHARALRLRSIALGLVLIPAVFWLVTTTNVVAKLLFRDDGVSSVTTLANRTIAWQAALAPKQSLWLEWLGGGLSMKRIEVPGQFWTRQILDSSWISALVQGGLIGFGLCLLLIFHSLARTFDSPQELRGLQIAIFLYLAFRGLLESGLFDASTSFIVLFTTILATPSCGRRGSDSPVVTVVSVNGTLLGTGQHRAQLRT